MNAARRIRLSVYLLLIAAWATVGCQAPVWPLFPPFPEEPGALDSAQPTHSASTDEASAGGANGDAPLAVPGLSDDRWVMNVRPMVPGVGEPAERWHHMLLDRTIAAPAARRPDVSSLLDHTNPVVAANAAIMMTRSRAGEPVEALAAAARNENFKLPLRQAAIESLGMITSLPARQAIEAMLKEADLPATGETRLTDLPEIYAELLAARARHVAVTEDTRFVTALKSQSPLVRVEAASAWARARVPAVAATPQALLDLCSDSDARVRIAALRAVAVHQHPRSVEYLTRATRDYDLNVRLSAIASLGLLGGSEAQRTLNALNQDRSEVTRAAVVGALAAAGVNEALLAAATDSSPRVRQAVAESLEQLKEDAAHIKEDAQALARQLVQDVSSDVQHRAVESLESWPLEKAGPVLLAAMEHGTYLTRKQAAEQLGRRWPPAESFYGDAPAERRNEQLAELKTRWQAEFGTLEELVARTATQEVAAAVGVSDEQMRQLPGWLARLSEPNLPAEARREVLAALRALGPAIVPALEGLSPDEWAALPVEIYRDVLPAASPVFARLERLASSDPLDRRTAAMELATELSGGRLSNLALERLLQLVRNQPDEIVWQTVLKLIAADARPMAEQLAYIAVANTSSEVRRRAAEYLRTHANPRHFEVLRGMLDDSDVTVAIAAVQAMGAAGIANPDLLVALLTASDRQLRLEAAVALARSKYESGIAAVERLGRDADPEIRRAATMAMGELRATVFVPVLIELLDDRRDIQIAALNSLVLIAGQNIGSPAGESVLPDEQVRRWKQWHRQTGP